MPDSGKLATNIVHFARLLRASDGSAAWSGSFDARYTGVFDMQDQISARVLQALAPRLQASAGVGAGLPSTEIHVLELSLLNGMMPEPPTDFTPPIWRSRSSMRAKTSMLPVLSSHCGRGNIT